MKSGEKRQTVLKLLTEAGTYGMADFQNTQYNNDASMWINSIVFLDFLVAIF